MNKGICCLPAPALPSARSGWLGRIGRQTGTEEESRDSPGLEIGQPLDMGTGSLGHPVDAPSALGEIQLWIYWPGAALQRQQQQQQQLSDSLR
ncbi:hypothetical protein Y1Q_0007491 [Alligator mississippiensis]|uniref:Uncharacterized protein n=1 Tax=Alligator mississippiensis TaxID=8496 RepID=A0A151M514_ALLMI|nr:hypothetical protein Y1Q_0007491 [Alligator mississippiensis]